MDPAHTGGVLRGKCCDDTGPVAVQRGEGLQVRLRRVQKPIKQPPKILGESRSDLDSSTSRGIASRDS